MSDLILFSQQPAYKGFLNKISNCRNRRTNSQLHKPVRPKLLQFQPSQQIQSALNKVLKNFRQSLKSFLQHHNGIDFNYVIYTFKKQNVLEQVAMMINSKLMDENAVLQEMLEGERQMVEKLRIQNQGNTYREQKKEPELKGNFNATNQEGNTEVARVLYEKAKECPLEEFNETLNSYFLKDKVKVTAIKDWPKGIDTKAESQAKEILQQAIGEVRKTIGKDTPKCSSEYIGNLLRDHFLGKRQKFQIVANMLTNDTILRYLSDMFESDGVPCPRPCCQILSRPNLEFARQPTPKQSARYLNSTKRSSQSCYKSDQINTYMQKFTNSMRERHAKQSDIFSISKSNLQATESYEKFFMKQLNKRKKMEYKERQKIDEQLRDFARSFK